MRACPKMLILFAAFVVIFTQNFIHVQASCSGTCPGSPACIDMQMCSGPPYHPTCGAPLPICSIPSTPILEVAPSAASSSPAVVVPTQEPPLEITSVTPSALSGTPSVQPGTNTTPNPNKPSTNKNGNLSPTSNTPPVNTNQPSGAQPSPGTSPTKAQPTKPPTSVNNNISPNSNSPPPSQQPPSTNQPSQTPPNTQPSTKPPTNANNNISPVGNTPPPPPPPPTSPSQPAAPPSTSPSQPAASPSTSPSQPAAPPSTSPSQPVAPQPTSPTNANSNISPVGNAPTKPASPSQPAPPQSASPNNANNNISPVGNPPPKPTSPLQPAPPQSTPPNNANSNVSPAGSTPPTTPSQPAPPPSANNNISPVTNAPTTPQTNNTPGNAGVSVNCGEMVKTCSDGNHVTVTVSVPVNSGTKPVVSSTNAPGGLQRDENLTKAFDFCPVTFKRKGCYKDKHDGIHPLPELLFTDRDSSSKVFSGTTISSKDWGNYILKLICRCAEQANQKRFTLFGIQHYGDCWSGMQSSLNNYESQGRSRACIGNDQAPCEEDSAACVGEDGANFVYELTGGPGPEKKNKIARKKRRIKVAKSKQTINPPTSKNLQKFKTSLNGLHRLRRPH